MPALPSEPKILLTPDEWDDLYARRRALKRIGAKRRTNVEAATLKAIDERISLCTNGADPLAPYGGIRITGIYLATLVLTTFDSLQNLRRHKARTLYWSLVCNSTALLFLGYMSDCCRHTASWADSLSTFSMRGGFALASLAFLVLQMERRDRRSEWRRIHPQVSVVAHASAVAEIAAAIVNDHVVSSATEDSRRAVRVNR